MKMVLLRLGLWLLLLLLTLASASFAEVADLHLFGLLIVLLITVVKATVISEYFMGLAEAPWLWRGLMMAYVPLVVSIIGLISFFTQGANY